MKVLTMSQFYHGLVIQRGPWENQQVIPPTYTKAGSAVNSAADTSTPSKFGLINQPLQEFYEKNPFLAPISKTNRHLRSYIGMKAAGILK